MKYLVNIVLILTVLVGISACQTTPKDDLQIVNALVDESQDAIQNKLDDKEKEEILEKLYPMLDAIDFKIDSLEREIKNLPTDHHKRKSGSQDLKTLEDLRGKVNGQTGVLQSSMTGPVPEKYLTWGLSAHQKREDVIKERQAEIRIEIRIDSLQALLEAMPDTALTRSAFSDSLFEREAFLLNQLDSLQGLIVKDSQDSTQTIAIIDEAPDDKQYLTQSEGTQVPSPKKETQASIKKQDTASEDFSLSKIILVYGGVLLGFVFIFLLLIEKVRRAMWRGLVRIFGRRLLVLGASVTALYLSVKAAGLWNWILSLLGKIFLLRFIDGITTKLWLRRTLKTIVVFGLLLFFLFCTDYGIGVKNWIIKSVSQISIPNWMGDLSWWKVVLVGVGLLIIFLIYRYWSVIRLMISGISGRVWFWLIFLSLLSLLVFLTWYHWDPIKDFIYAKLKTEEVIEEWPKEEDSSPAEEKREPSPGEKEEVVDPNEIEIIPPPNPFPEETEGDQKKELLEKRKKKDQKKKLKPENQNRKKKFKKPSRKRGVGRDLAAKKDLKLLPGYAPGTSTENSKQVRRID